MQRLGYFILFFLSCTSASNTIDVHSLIPKNGDECLEYALCGALGRHPCQTSFGEELNQCGPCINGFVQMSDESRVCRRIKPSDRKDGSSLIIDDFVLDKRASYADSGMYLVSSSDHSLNAAANRHTITFLILISMAVAGVIIVAVLGLAYHKYSTRELKNVGRSSNRRVSYGFEGTDDNEEKELARKTQIYHYQHQKRMISSMESRKAAATSGEEKDELSNGHEDPLLLDKVVEGTPSGSVGGGSSTRSSLLRMRSQGSMGSPKEARSVRMNQHQSIDRVASLNQKTVQGHTHNPPEDSEGEVDPDFTVYECPGLAPSGEMEVKNPLFSNDEDNVDPTDEEEEEE